MEVGLQSNYKLSAKNFAILDSNGSMKTNRLKKVFGFIILSLFSNSCFDENPSIDSVNEKEILLIINAEGITSQKFKKATEQVDAGGGCASM